MGTPSFYVGETSRYLRERMQEHSEDARNDTEGSHIANHLKSVHPQEWLELGSVKIMKTHQSAFKRQLHEAATINMETGVLLNNLEEYSRCLVPTIEVKGNKKESSKSKEMRVDRMKSREAEANLVLNTIQETRWLIEQGNEWDKWD